MNRLKISVIVFTFLSHTTSTKNTTEKSWIGDIETRKLFVGQRIASMRDLMEGDPEIKDIDSFISKYPHLMYAAMKCKYADTVMDMLNTFYEITQFSLETVIEQKAKKDASTSAPRTTLIKTIINHFNDTKPHFVRILYNLFYYPDGVPKLRTSEQRFIKTILSINLFLYNNSRYNSFIVTQQSTTGGDENKTDEYYAELQMTRSTNFLVQMMGLIKWFRLKNCFVENTCSNTKEFETDLKNKYNLNDVGVVTGLLRSKISVLESLAVRTPVNLEHYYEEMYDPESLLLSDLFRSGPPIVAKAKVKFAGRDFPLANVYERVEQSYDLDYVLEYQNCLFEIISNIFARQIDEGSTISKLKSLHRSLRTFTGFVMPVSCASSACILIHTVEKNLEFFIFHYDRIQTYELKEKIDKMKEELKKFYDGKCWESEDDLQDVRSVSLSDLVSNIIDNKRFQSFRQVATLLSYESEANRNHRLFEVDAISSEVTTEEVGETGYELFRLRSVLFSFSKLSAYTFDVTKISENDFEQAFGYAANSVIDVYERHGKKDDRVSDVLLPLLIHFRYVNDPSYTLTQFVCTRLEHVVLFAIVAIDNYLSRVHRRPLHDSRWRFARRSDPTASLIFLKNSSSADPETMDDFITGYLNVLYARQFYHEELLELQIADPHIRVYWNGANAPVSEALRTVPQAVNDSQDLIRYRWLVCKWMAARVFLKIKCALMKAGDLESLLEDKYRIMLIEMAKGFTKLDLPQSMAQFFKDTMWWFIMALSFKSPFFDDNLLDFAMSTVNRGIFMLGVAINQMPYVDIKNIIHDLTVDMDQFVMTLQFLKNDQILYSDKTSFPSSVFNL